MKKKRKLKGWVKVLLKILLIISFVLGASDSDNTKIFVIAHLISLVLMIFSGTILIKNMEVR